MALGSEDCLYLNVYTQTLHPDTPKAVMVFIHGGGFVWGSGNEDNYGPDFLVEQDVVLVTFNYRLGALGFLCLDTKDVPGNAGMKDQVAALKWIKNNIEQFGGDPHNITIFGESAGSISAELQLTSPLSKGLFHRALLMSSFVTEELFALQPRRRAFALGKQLGIETDDPAVLLNFLQKAPVDKIVTTDINLDEYEERAAGLWKIRKYTPVIEKKLGQEPFLDEFPEELIKKGAGSDIDVMAGITDEEGIFMVTLFKENYVELHNKYPEYFVPGNLAMKISHDKILKLAHKIRNHYFKLDLKVGRELVTYINESFFYNLSGLMSLLSKSGKSKRYVYRFCCVSERNIYGSEGLKYGVTGAAHLDDMVYLFDPKRVNLKLDPNSKSYEMIKLSCKVFTNFAKFGTLTPDSSLGVTWPEYNERTRRHVDIGATLTLGADLGVDAYDFWKQIYDEANDTSTD